MKKEYKLFITNNYIYVMPNNKIIKIPINKKEVIINDYLIVNHKILKNKIKKILSIYLPNKGILLSNIIVYVFKKYPTTEQLLKEMFKELEFKIVIIKEITIPRNIHLLFINKNKLETISSNTNNFSVLLNTSKHHNYIIIGTREIARYIESKYHIKIFYYKELKFYKKILSQ